MRAFSPVLFFAAAAGVFWYNGQHTDRALVLPFMDVIDPGAASDPVRQGQLTVQILVGVGVVLAWRAIFAHWRAGRG